MPMSSQEKGLWEKSRKKGAVKFILKNSLTSYLTVFLIYFIGNAFYHLDKLDVYVRKNLWDNLDYTLLVSFITITVLLIVSAIIWAINEKRYKESE